MSAEDIEASKAPLMDHLIELRSRLIKALLAFGIAFIFCFFFAKQIYNVLVWPFVWVAGPENSKFIYTALLEYFLTPFNLPIFRPPFPSFRFFPLGRPAVLAPPPVDTPGLACDPSFVSLRGRDLRGPQGGKEGRGRAGLAPAAARQPAAPRGQSGRVGRQGRIFPYHCA